MMLIEKIAATIDPEIWEMGAPIPTRADTISFHSRRQDSVRLATKITSSIADWLEPQRNDIPAHGWEFAQAIRAESSNAAA